eukprot:282690_1
MHSSKAIFYETEEYMSEHTKEKVMSYMTMLCAQSIKLNIDLKEDINNTYRQQFVSELSHLCVGNFNTDTAEQMKSLWSDEGIKETLKQRSEFEISDNVEYLMNKIEEIACTKYHISFEDYLRIGMTTRGVKYERFEKEINGKQHSFLFTDVGGNRSERKKWIMIDYDIDVVVYVVAISEY